MRPVTGRQASRVCPPPVASTRTRVKLGLPSARTQRPMIESPRRAMGASISQRSALMTPSASARVAFLRAGRQRRGRKRVLCSSTRAAGVFVDAVDRPEYPPPAPAAAGGTASRWPAMPPLWFSVGCTAIPAGLSTRAVNSSSYSRENGTGCGCTAVGGSGGSAKVMRCPARTGWSVCSGRPSAKKPSP